MKLGYRITLIGLATAAVAGFVYSQIHIHEKNRREIKDVAAHLAFTWKQQLGLNIEQTEMLKNAIIEYTIKKNEIINSSLATVQQVNKLRTIQKSEHKALHKFMTDEQFEQYLQMNKQLTRKH